MTRNVYWDVVTRRAAEYTEAQLAPDADLASGLPILLDHARQFGAHCITHIAQVCLLAMVDADAPAEVRTITGTVNLSRLLPDSPDALTTLDTAGTLTHALGITPSEAMTDVEEQIAATVRARGALQAVFDNAPHGAAGRKRAIEVLYELRDDPRALCAVVALTAAALQSVRPVHG
ncbi:hypothetical protein [Streptomyces sp. IBSBF 2950]|uniref:hypothetical protein n=1 Tax=Streptomyces sp. IBSBF 2950 TaxID=2903528 RepID=UPI002FDBEFA4